MKAAAGSPSGAAGSPPSPPLTPRPDPSPVPIGNAPAPGAATALCPFCGRETDGPLPYCPHCGRRLSAPGSGPACMRCGSPVALGSRFCATCGAPLAEGPTGLSRPSSRPMPRTDFTVTLVVLDESGNPAQTFQSTKRETAIGRMEGDIRFPDDPFLSPLHAKLSWEQDRLVVRDLGSRNGTWVFLTEPHRLVDGDLVLIGSQIIRFRRLGYPGPYAADADATKRIGSLTPNADIAQLAQLRADRSVRDVIQLSPGRDVEIGRERGDWVFPYDPSLSAQHALVRSEDADFVLVDAGSRNGCALAVRGEMVLHNGSRLLVGDKLMRIELAS
ncbi:MAG TPA: FHA domain-containing protein [Gemmatimonadales bacterium]|nr:FHA domain-containing protein [Gemmatimonadales bacterium]